MTGLFLLLPRWPPALLAILTRGFGFGWTRDAFVGKSTFATKGDRVWILARHLCRLAKDLRKRLAPPSQVRAEKFSPLVVHAIHRAAEDVSDFGVVRIHVEEGVAKDALRLAVGVECDVVCVKHEQIIPKPLWVVKWAKTLAIQGVSV